MAQVPSLRPFGCRATGGRICFKTDAPSFTLRARVKILAENETTSNLFTSGFDAYVGKRQTSYYAGHMCVKRNTGGWIDLEKEFSMAGGDEATIFLPPTVMIKSVTVAIDEGFSLFEPTPYKWRRPIVFYGSSITAGGAASRVGNAYVSLLSRWLDADYMNFGFPGNARGEVALARYLATLDMGAFVYDYDHNAETPEALAKTHKPFFDIIRAARPDVPVIMLTRPGLELDSADAARREAVVRATYEAALAEGDKKVRFIRGRDLFGEEERHACTIDGTHPTDYGFMQMAKHILPTLKEALELAP